MNPLPQVSAYCIRGQFGWFASQGIDALCTQLRAIPHVNATIWNWRDQQAIVDSIRADHNLIVIIGYSLGATYAPRIARYASIVIELIMGLDPSQSYLVESIPSNVKKTICFYNPNAWFFGGVTYKGHGPIENIPLAGDVHLGIDWDARCWSRAMDEIRYLAHD